MDQYQLSETSKLHILGGLLYFTSCRQAYLQMIKDRPKMILDPDEMTPYSLIESTIRFFIRVDINVSHVAIMQKLMETINNLPPQMQATMTDSFSMVMVQLDDKEVFSEQITSNILQNLNKKLTLEELTSYFSHSRSMSDIKTKLQDVTTQLSSMEHPGKLQLYNPVAAARDLMKHREKVPTGISFLDHLLGGGIVWGHHGGCLGASGSGKTTLANMIICNLAIRGYNSLLLQFEQSVKHDSDVLARIYAYLTGLPRNEFANKTVDEWTPEAAEALEKCAEISDRIRVGSFTDDNIDRSVKSIIDAINDSIEDGFRPKMVVIDWLGAVVSEFLSQGDGNTNQNYPLCAQEVQDELMAYGKKQGISFFFLHQLSNMAAGKPPAYKPTRFDSYFFGGFAQKLEYCLQIGNKSKQPDGKSACWLVCGKVRDAEPDKAEVVLLDGAHARMERTEEGEYTINSKGNFIRTKQLLGAVDDPVVEIEPDTVGKYMEGF